MPSKLDEILSLAEQSAWLDAPPLDETMGTRAPPILADARYDDRLRTLMQCEEWPAFAAFLRSYVENGVPRPFETQPDGERVGWWNFTIGEGGGRVHVNIWRQYAADVDFRFDEEGELRAYCRIWIDKQTAEDALAGGASLPQTFTLRPTTLKGCERDPLMLVVQKSTFEETVDAFNLPWLIRAIRVANLDLMRGGQLNFGWQKFHVAKLLDAVFSEPLSSVNGAEIAHALETAIPDLALRTEIEATIWRRMNTHLFARPVMSRAGWKCAISGVEAVELLEACHIKSWTEANDSERLDPDNGLCLAAHLHAAFDVHLLSVDPDGLVVISDRLSIEDRARLNLIAGVRVAVTLEQRRYLELRHTQFTQAQSAEERPNFVRT